MSKLNEATNKVVEINGHRAEFSSEVPIFYFEDQVLGSQWIVDYVTGLFNIDVRRLAIGRNSTWAVDWINERQEKSMNRVLLVEPTNNDSKADEAVDYVLKNARSSDWIGIDEYVSDNYRFNGKLGPVQEVSISEKGYWVTCDNLMNFDAIEIYIGNSRLTISDLNPFLRHWRAGGSPRLEYLEVCLENGTIFENFDDDLEAVRTNEVGRYPVSFGNPVVIHNCYSILRMDGVKALFICDRYFHFIVQHGKATNYENSRQVSIANSGYEKKGIVLSTVHVSKINEALNEVVEINGYKTEFWSEFLIIYFEDQVLGSKWIVDYVTTLFNIDVRGLAIDRCSTWAIDWINKRQEKPLSHFGLLKPTNDVSNADESVDYVLKNARSSELLGIDEYVSDNYRFNGKLGPVKELCLWHGHWVTCDSLMNFDAIEIYIGRSRLAVSDLNSFLRHWRAGGSPRLHYLEVRFENKAVFENFDEDLEIVRTNEVGTYPVSYGELVVIRSCYSVQRLDGIRALVSCDHRRFYLIVQHEKTSN
ncbi:unnamed protein product [Caenorhabditis nigoni]